MSSFLGHSLAAVTVYVGTEFLICPTGNTKLKSQAKSSNLIWIGWLIVVASIPDLDYVVHAWNSTNNQGLRITHSVLFSLIVPCLTIAVLIALKQNNFWQRSIEIVLAGLSHLALDLFVGVTPLPLMFPLVKIPFKLPFGVLPSAGRIDLNNYYFYRNLLFEMGVLLPIFTIVGLLSAEKIFWRKDRSFSRFIGLLLVIPLLLCISYFVQQNLQLPR